MLTRNELKYYQSLLQKKNRNESNKFIVEGKRIVEEGLKSNFVCDIIIASTAFSESNKEFYSELLKSKHRIEIVKNNDFEKLSDTKHTQGIAAVFKTKRKDEKSIGFSSPIAVLDNISDPGNAGTIIRSCDWFGVKEIILGNNSVELYNPKLLRATMGSIFHMNIFESDDLESSLKLLQQKKYSILCADIKGENIFSYVPEKKSAIVFSNEAEGPSVEIKNLSDRIITIPQLGNAESLNVASASAVILAELTKRI